MLRRRPGSAGSPTEKVLRDKLHRHISRKAGARPMHVIALRAERRERMAALRRPRKQEQPRALSTLLLSGSAPWREDGYDARGEVAPADEPSQWPSNGGGSAEKSLVVLCCLCGVKLDDEEGVPIRPSIGECDAEDCAHWACIRCSGVHAGYSGRWVCGCSGCSSRGQTNGTPPANAASADWRRASAQSAPAPAWVQCEACLKWRAISVEAAAKIAADPSNLWYCHHNPKKLYNKCHKPQEPFEGESPAQAQPTQRKRSRDGKPQPAARAGEGAVTAEPPQTLAKSPAKSPAKPLAKSPALPRGRPQAIAACDRGKLARVRLKLKGCEPCGRDVSADVGEGVECDEAEEMGSPRGSVCSDSDSAAAAPSSRDAGGFARLSTRREDIDFPRDDLWQKSQKALLTAEEALCECSRSVGSKVVERYRRRKAASSEARRLTLHSAAPMWTDPDAPAGPERDLASSTVNSRGSRREHRNLVRERRPGCARGVHTRRACGARAAHS